MINDHAGLAAYGLFDLFHRGHVHRNVLALSCLRVPGGQFRGFGDGVVPGLCAVALNDHMAAVELLHMEPDVTLGALLQGQLVILAVVPAHPNGEALRGHKLHGSGRLGLHFLFLIGIPDVAAQNQLLPDLRHVFFRLCPGQLIENGVDVLQFHLALGDLLRQNLFGSLGPVVIFIKLRSVLLG